MHGLVTPHCAYCEHFESCFQSDDVTEWGYCSHKVVGKIPPQQEIERVRRMVDCGDQQSLLDEAGWAGLFVPGETDCRFFTDYFPV